MDRKTFHVVSLGCAKNSVDSDSIAQLLRNNNYVQVDNAKQASVIVVNTCGFIQEAREQAYKELEILAGNKKPGQTLIAAGCLTQRYGVEVVHRIPEIDGILGTHHWMDIVDMVQEIREGKFKIEFL